MDRREAAQRLVELCEKFPHPRPIPGFTWPLQLEEVESTIRRNHFVLGEESLKTHPLYPPMLRSRFLREQTEGESAELAERERKALEFLQRKAELEASEARKATAQSEARDELERLRAKIEALKLRKAELEK